MIERLVNRNRDPQGLGMITGHTRTFCNRRVRNKSTKSRQRNKLGHGHFGLHGVRNEADLMSFMM